MVEQGSGSIISTASVAGLVGWHGAAAYSATKAAVVNLTRTAAVEYAKYGVRVNCICPGVIQTAMVERITGGTSESLERLKRMQPLPRIGQPEDIARMALISPQTSLHSSPERRWSWMAVTCLAPNSGG
jgi:NAD(P)-dependent dehydrogenase (short-subunit alcohol dehydrogenase family)